MCNWRHADDCISLPRLNKLFVNVRLTMMKNIDPIACNLMFISSATTAVL